MTKIAQIAVNISFNVGFQDLIVFSGLGCFIFWREDSRFFLNLEHQNRHIIDFVVNKSLFSQTKYVLICFTH